jgi:hypothetical protein
VCGAAGFDPAPLGNEFLLLFYLTSRRGCWLLALIFLCKHGKIQHSRVYKHTGPPSPLLLSTHQPTTKSEGLLLFPNVHIHRATTTTTTKQHPKHTCHAAVGCAFILPFSGGHSEGGQRWSLFESRETDKNWLRSEQSNIWSIQPIHTRTYNTPAPPDCQSNSFQLSSCGLEKLKHFFLPRSLFFGLKK